MSDNVKETVMVTEADMVVSLVGVSDIVDVFIVSLINNVN